MQFAKSREGQCLRQNEDFSLNMSRRLSFLLRWRSRTVQMFSPPPQIWLTFAPVANQTSQYLGVSLEEVNWFSVVFMVVAIPLTFGATWMIDTVGLRITVQKYWHLTGRKFSLWCFWCWLLKLRSCVRLFLCVFVWTAADSGILAEHGWCTGARLWNAGRGNLHSPVRCSHVGPDLRRPGAALHHFRPHQACSPLVPRSPACNS